MDLTNLTTDMLWRELARRAIREEAKGWNANFPAEPISGTEAAANLTGLDDRELGEALAGDFRKAITEVCIEDEFKEKQ